MDFGDDTTQIIITIIGAIIGTGLIIKFVSKKKTTNNSSRINIRDSKIGGDVAGRDIKK